MGWRAFYPASIFDTYAATAKRTTRSRMIMTFESVCGWSNTCRVDAQRLRWKPRDRHLGERALHTSATALARVGALRPATRMPGSEITRRRVEGDSHSGRTS